MYYFLTKIIKRTKVEGDNMIKVSIIVPIYNIDNIFLSKCIESLLKQTLKDIDIILVDDGSPNKKYSKLCDDYAKDNINIKVIHKKNSALA